MYVSKRNLYFDTPEPENKVVMNLLSGSMDLLDKEMFQFLKNIQRKGVAQPTEENKTVLMKCLEQGYIYNDKQEEEKKLMELSNAWYESVKNRVETITIYPTFTCNLHCVYCFENQKSKNKPGVMSIETLNALMRAIDIIHESHGANDSPMVTIFGGEPLLRRKSQIDLIEQLLKALRKRDFRIGVITNGVELPYFVETLSNYGVDIIEVTIDGPKEIHDQRRIFHNGKGSFDKVINGIDSAIAKKINTVVRVNLDKENINFMPKLADYILQKQWVEQGAELHIHALDAAGSENTTRCDRVSLEMFSKLFKMFESDKKTKIFSFIHRVVRFFEDLLNYGRLPFPQISYCGAIAGNKYSFDLFGKIFPCCCMNCCALEEFNHGEFCPELKFNNKIIDKWRKRDVLNLPQCRDCPEALLCGGGCTRIALMSGERLEDGVSCPSIREEFQTALNYYYPMLKKKFFDNENYVNSVQNQKGYL